MVCKEANVFVHMHIICPVLTPNGPPETQMKRAHIIGSVIIAPESPAQASFTDGLVRWVPDILVPNMALALSLLWVTVRRTYLSVYELL